MLLLPLLLALTLGIQAVPGDRQHAEAMARAGKTAEAMALFEHVVELDPRDTEARLWIARLALRLGRTKDAEAGFRAVLRDHPQDVDARIGLAVTLTRMGAWEDALVILTAIEGAENNAELAAALGRAHRRGGDDRRAVEAFARARALGPDDPDNVLGYEAVARVYGHWISTEGYGELGAPGANAWSGSILGDARVMPRLHLQGGVRMQQGAGYSDVLVGGGGLWRARKNTTLAVRAFGGPDNSALPTADLSGDAVHYAGVFEVGGGVRWLSFDGIQVVALSPVFAWTAGDRWRLDTRYTYSRSSFERIDRASNDHSIVLRESWQGWRRVALSAAYAHGIERFENLTVDRLVSLDTSTIAGGGQIDLPSLTRIAISGEYQRRSNDTRITRITASIVKWIP